MFASFFDRRCALKHRFVLSVLIVTCLLALHAALAREWTDSSGTRKIEAELVKLDGDVVHLKKPDGAIVKVPLSKLCEDDRKFVSQQTAAPVPPVTVIKIRPGQVVAPPDALVRSTGRATAQRDEARIKFLTEKLGLDADQQAKITAIYEADDLKLKELMNKRKYSPQVLREMLKAKNDAVNAVLTPEQQDKFKGLGSGANAIRAPRRTQIRPGPARRSRQRASGPAALHQCGRPGWCRSFRHRCRPMGRREPRGHLCSTENRLPRAGQRDGNQSLPEGGER